MSRTHALWILILSATCCFAQANDPFVRDSRQMEIELQNNNLPTIKLLLDHGYIDRNESRNGFPRADGLSFPWTYIIIMNKHLSAKDKEGLLDLFYKEGADPNRPIKRHGQALSYPLNWVVRNVHGSDSYSLTEYLLTKGVVDQQGIEPNPPLVMTLVHSVTPPQEQVDFVLKFYKMVVSHGVDPNPRWGVQSAFRRLVKQTVFHMDYPSAVNKAAFEADMQMMDLMLAVNKGKGIVADMNRRDDCGLMIGEYISSIGAGPSKCVSHLTSIDVPLSSSEYHRLFATLGSAGAGIVGMLNNCDGCPSFQNPPDMSIFVTYKAY